MDTKKKKLIAAIGVLLLVLLFTNPSEESFRNYYKNTVSYEKRFTFRQFNFHIFSLYKGQGTSYNGHRKDWSTGYGIDTYIGVFGNFIKL